MNASERHEYFFLLWHVPSAFVIPWHEWPAILFTTSITRGTGNEMSFDVQENFISRKKKKKRNGFTALDNLSVIRLTSVRPLFKGGVKSSYFN